jgi:hypothetical protein
LQKPTGWGRNGNLVLALTDVENQLLFIIIGLQNVEKNDLELRLFGVYKSPTALGFWHGTQS